MEIKDENFKMLSDKFCIYGNLSDGLVRVRKNGLFGYVDKTGKEVIPCIYEEAYDFSEGLAVVKKRGKGYIDKEGKEVIPCIYKTAYDFRDGLACVQNEKYLYGFIDKTGKEVIPCIYRSASIFNEDLARVSVRKKDFYGFYDYFKGFINKKGEEVIPCIYEDANDFSEGLAVVRKNGLFGYVDKTGKEVIPCIYEDAHDFNRGFACVQKNIENDLFTIINKEGKTIIDSVEKYYIENDGDFLFNIEEYLEDITKGKQYTLHK